jgi:hypothetical protein
MLPAEQRSLIEESTPRPDAFRAGGAFLDPARHRQDARVRMGPLALRHLRKATSRHERQRRRSTTRSTSTRPSAAAGAQRPRGAASARARAPMARVPRAPPAPPRPGGVLLPPDSDDDWLPHPCRGGMKIPSKRSARIRAVPRRRARHRFPAHHHGGDEECYVIPGACSRAAGALARATPSRRRRQRPWRALTEDGCRVLLIVSPEDYLPPAAV